MADAYLEVEMGSLRFKAEGSEKWVEQQWAEITKQAKDPALRALRESKPGAATKAEENGQKFTTSLAKFLIEKSTGASQVKRFLATAVWLSKSGQSTLKTSDVTKALLDARQKKLGNPADVLNQNVAKGFCVKHGEGFYVSPEGEEALQ